MCCGSGGGVVGDSKCMVVTTKSLSNLITIACFVCWLAEITDYPHRQRCNQLACSSIIHFMEQNYFNFQRWYFPIGSCPCFVFGIHYIYIHHCKVLCLVCHNNKNRCFSFRFIQDTNLCIQICFIRSEFEILFSRIYRWVFYGLSC